VCAAPTANGSAACAQMTGGPACTFNCNTGFHACMATCMSNTDDPSNDPCVVADGLVAQGVRDATLATSG